MWQHLYDVGVPAARDSPAAAVGIPGTPASYRLLHMLPINSP